MQLNLTKYILSITIYSLYFLGFYPKQLMELSLFDRIPAVQEDEIYQRWKALITVQVKQ